MDLREGPGAKDLGSSMESREGPGAKHLGSSTELREGQELNIWELADKEFKGM